MEPVSPKFVEALKERPAAAIERLAATVAAIEAGCDAGWAYVGHMGPGDGELDIKLMPVLLPPANGPEVGPSAELDDNPNRCGWGDCREPATTAFTFRDQPGHVHNCNEHAAINREWADVTSSAPLPNCPYLHDGTTWTAVPRDL